MSRRATLLRLWLDGDGEVTSVVAHVLLRMVEDPAGEAPGLLHTHGHTVVHDGGTLPRDAPSTRALLRHLQASFGPRGGGQTARPDGDHRAPTRPASPDATAAVRALRRAARRAAAASGLGVHARLEVGSSYWDDAPLPPFFWGHLTAEGAPAPWPFPPELIQWRLGLRRLLKCTDPDPDRRATTQARLRALGLVVTDVPPGAGSGPHSFLAARSQEELTEALARERELCGLGPAARAAQRWFGAALGYPACCVDAFEALHRHDDATLRAALLPRLDTGPHTPLTSWVVPPLTLVPHSPCRLDCPATQALARRTLDALEAERPGFRLRWLAFSQALAVVDARGVGWSLQLDHAGPLRPGDEVRVVSGWRIAAAPPAPVRPARELVGRRLVVGAWGLLERRSGWRGVFAADHRRPLDDHAEP